MRIARTGILAATRQFRGDIADWFTVFALTQRSEVASIGWGNYTFRMVVPASMVVRPAHKLRLTFHAAGSGPTQIKDAFVGRGATLPTYAFSGTPSRITFGGLNGVSAAPYVDTVSDAIDVEIQAHTSLVIALAFGTSSALANAPPGTLGGQAYHYKAGNDAATVGAASYSSTTAGQFSFRKVELFG